MDERRRMVPSPVGPTIFDQRIPRVGLSFQTSPALTEIRLPISGLALAIVRDGPRNIAALLQAINELANRLHKPPRVGRRNYCRCVKSLVSSIYSFFNGLLLIK